MGELNRIWWRRRRKMWWLWSRGGGDCGSLNGAVKHVPHTHHGAQSSRRLCGQQQSIGQLTDATLRRNRRRCRTNLLLLLLLPEQQCRYHVSYNRFRYCAPRQRCVAASPFRRGRGGHDNIGVRRKVGGGGGVHCCDCREAVLQHLIQPSLGGGFRSRSRGVNIKETRRRRGGGG